MSEEKGEAMETEVAAARPREFTPETDKGLKGGAVGLLSSVVIGVSSTAPAYSLAASLGFVAMVGGMGTKSPAIIIVAFIPMLLIAGAYYYLNKVDPDCGTTFMWTVRCLWPSLGLGHGLGHGGGRHHRHGELGADHGLVFLPAFRTR